MLEAEHRQLRVGEVPQFEFAKLVLMKFEKHVCAQAGMRFVRLEGKDSVCALACVENAYTSKRRLDGKTAIIGKTVDSRSQRSLRC